MSNRFHKFSSSLAELLENLWNLFGTHKFSSSLAGLLENLWNLFGTREWCMKNNEKCEKILTEDRKVMKC